MRSKLHLAVAALAAGTLVASSPAAAPTKKAVARDWTRTVVATPEGGFRMGNPAAKVKLVEYGSLTCPHCRHFAEQGAGPLRSKYVKTGKVSYEFRNMVLNGVDVAVTLVARCGGAAQFFPMADHLYATQTQWVGKITGVSGADKEALEKLPQAAQMARLLDIGGITAIAQRHGIAPARAKACAADQAGFQRLVKMYEGANALGVTGTPTFFINGAKVDGIEWSDLEPQLRKAGG